MERDNKELVECLDLIEDQTKTQLEYDIDSKYRDIINRYEIELSNLKNRLNLFENGHEEQILKKMIMNDEKHAKKLFNEFSRTNTFRDTKRSRSKRNRTRDVSRSKSFKKTNAFKSQLKQIEVKEENLKLKNQILQQQEKIMKLVKDNKSMKSEMETLKQEISQRFSDSSDLQNLNFEDRNSLRDISGKKASENNASKGHFLNRNTTKMEIEESPFSQPKVSFGTTMPSASKSALKKNINFK